jgi:hypothetical protein
MHMFFISITNILPVWPTYFNGQSRHFIWYMLLLLHLSVCKWCFNILFIMFCVQKATLSCVFLKSLVICLTSFPQHVKVAHFVLWCLSHCVCFVFVVVIVRSQVGLCYICFLVVLMFTILSKVSKPLTIMHYIFHSLIQLCNKGF